MINRQFIELSYQITLFILQTVVLLFLIVLIVLLFLNCSFLTLLGGGTEGARREGRAVSINVQSANCCFSPPLGLTQFRVCIFHKFSYRGM